MCFFVTHCTYQFLCAKKYTKSNKKSDINMRLRSIIIDLHEILKENYRMLENAEDSSTENGLKMMK